ncbi:type I-E CRISPR-associated protein Cas5/CasD [Actinoplanes siamensis]|uniref:Type I-E CRISPR-associated protein Cas5/CasD n=1 Tax=Actinoplanes siamensis TaxID=1223317 RepID=A0A919N526_9ACTN|nr:type I-E CRISPR-associated protein Cas5/CasD [Actinoplanes siamensis]GIF04422.1 type I-E CRISPR-associated protein Cas5/CasD [Actinoplanes siamensis]
MNTALTPPRCLVLRLAAPLQSWGGPSRFNRRDTMPEPTKGGIVGLLAAAQGRRRQDPIEDLLGLSLGVRTDRPGSLLRDYHTASNLDGSPLPSAQTNNRGRQKATSPAKNTYVTTRYYLQDAVFVAAVHGPLELLGALTAALANPRFPLALGRRSCPPTQPLVLPYTGPDKPLWPGTLTEVLQAVPRQGGRLGGRRPLAATIDDPAGDEVRIDVPRTFDPKNRSYATRTVRNIWVDPPSDAPAEASPDDHDPFALTY